MTVFPYEPSTRLPKRLGLVVLQSDETVEDDFRSLLPNGVSLLVSRVPSDANVTTETLSAMKDHLTSAASLFPSGMTFDALGYACTSGTAQIGAAQIEMLIRKGTRAFATTEPVSALVAACRMLNIRRIAFLSPYIESVSERLMDVLRDEGIESPVFGTFAEAEEAKVARIGAPSIIDASCDLMKNAPVDALFLSCTNLRTLSLIPELEETLGCPVLSSNLVLAWHLQRLAGVFAEDVLPGDLLQY